MEGKEKKRKGNSNWRGVEKGQRWEEESEWKERRRGARGREEKGMGMG